MLQGKQSLINSSKMFSPSEIGAVSGWTVPMSPFDGGKRSTQSSMTVQDISLAFVDKAWLEFATSEDRKHFTKSWVRPTADN